MGDFVSGTTSVYNSFIRGIDSTFKETTAFWTSKKPQEVKPLDEAAVLGAAAAWPAWMILGEIGCTTDTISFEISFETAPPCDLSSTIQIETTYITAPDLWLFMATYAIGLGEYSTAIDFYESLITWPEDICLNVIGRDPYEIPGECYIDLVDLYALIGDQAKADEITEQRKTECGIVPGFVDPQTMFIAGTEYLDQDLCAYAKYEFGEILNNYPDDLFALFAQEYIDLINEDCQMTDEFYCSCE